VELAARPVVTADLQVVGADSGPRIDVDVTCVLFFEPHQVFAACGFEEGAHPVVHFDGRSLSCRRDLAMDRIWEQGPHDSMATRSPFSTRPVPATAGAGFINAAPQRRRNCAGVSSRQAELLSAGSSSGHRSAANGARRPVRPPASALPRMREVVEPITPPNRPAICRQFRPRPQVHLVASLRRRGRPEVSGCWGTSMAPGLVWR